MKRRLRILDTRSFLGSARVVISGAIRAIRKFLGRFNFVARRTSTVTESRWLNEFIVTREIFFHLLLSPKRRSEKKSGILQNNLTVFERQTISRARKTALMICYGG